MFIILNRLNPHQKLIFFFNRLLIKNPREPIRYNIGNFILRLCQQIRIFLPNGLNLIIQRSDSLKQFLYTTTLIFLRLLLLFSKAIINNTNIIFASSGEKIHQFNNISLLQIQQFILLYLRYYLFENYLGLFTFMIGLFCPLVYCILMSVYLCVFLLGLGVC